MIGILIGVRYAQIQKRDCEVISSAGIERPGESERALTCIASESAGQEDAQRARIVLPEGTDVPSPSWPAGLAGRHSCPALSTACLRGPIRKHQKMQFRERDVLMVYLEDMKKIMIENNKKSEKTKMILVTRLCGAGHAWGECV